MKKKIRYRTVRDAYRNLNKIREVIRLHYGTPSDKVFISDIVLIPDIDPKADNQMIMTVKVTWPVGLARYYETKIRNQEYNQNVDIARLDMDMWCSIHLGMDEYGKIFAYIDDLARNRVYDFEGPKDIGKKFAKTFLDKQYNLLASK